MFKKPEKFPDPFPLFAYLHVKKLFSTTVPTRPFLLHQEALKGNIKRFRERSRNIYKDTRDRRTSERVRRKAKIIYRAKLKICTRRRRLDENVTRDLSIIKITFFLESFQCRRMRKIYIHHANAIKAIYLIRNLLRMLCCDNALWRSYSMRKAIFFSIKNQYFMAALYSFFLITRFNTVETRISFVITDKVWNISVSSQTECRFATCTPPTSISFWSI